MSDNLTVFGTDYTGVTKLKVKSTDNGYLTYVRPQGTITIAENGNNIDITNYATANVSVAGGGGGSSANPSDPIRFFDYDGTLVASYTSVPSTLPNVPTHAKLTNGAWNYTLQQITTQFNTNGTCDIGANYDTVSGATEIDVCFTNAARLHPYLSLAVNGTVSIDWGDGSTPDTVTGTSLSTRKTDIHHEYATTGSYTISITKTSGTGYSFYGTTTYTLLFKNSTLNENKVYSNCVKAIRIGSNCTIANHAFYGCYSLASITIPSSITSIGNNVFSYCSSLVFVSIPSNVTDIGSNVFSNCCSLVSIAIPNNVTSIGTSALTSCYSLTSITIPNNVVTIESSAFSYCCALGSITIPSSVTSIGTSAFSACYSLASITIPSNVTSIGNSAFSNCIALASVTVSNSVTSIGNSAFGGCYGMGEYHIKPTTPPTLGTTAFNYIVSDCVIYVPSTSLTSYQEAENWSTYASYMVGE